MISAFRLYTFFLLVALTLFGVLKPVSLLPDMETYKEYFEGVKSGYVILVEFSYVLLSRLVLTFSESFRWVIFFYVFTSLYIKFNCFRLFESKYAILFMYLSSLLILHEFIQIRIALALSFLLLAVTVASKNKAASISCFVLACFFHVSAFLFAIFYFSSSLFEKRRLLSVVYFSFLFLFLMFFADILNLINFSSSNYIINKVEIYVNASSVANEHVNVLSLRLIILYLTIFLVGIKIHRLDKLGFTFYFCVVSLTALAVGLKAFPDISFRFFDMAVFFSIFMIASLSKYYPRVVYYTMFSLFILSAVYYNYRLIGYVSV